jgi:hypothetical protein
MVALHTADMLPNCGAHEQPRGSPRTTRQRGGWLYRAIYVEPRLQRRSAASFGALSAGRHGSRAGAGQTRSAGYRAPSHKRQWPQGPYSIKRSPADAGRVKTPLIKNPAVLGRGAELMGLSHMSTPAVYGTGHACWLRNCHTIEQSRAVGCLNLLLDELCSAVQLLYYFYMGWRQITVALLTVTAAGAALTFAIDLARYAFASWH